MKDVSILAQNIGLFIEYWGFKSIHGETWCHLYLSKTPLDAGELIERTGVSKALMSQTLSELIDYKVIEAQLKVGSKRSCYRADPDILKAIFGILRQRECRIINDISFSQKILAGLRSEELECAQLDHDRIKRLGKMVYLAQTFLRAFLGLRNVNFGNWKKVL